MVTTQTLKKKPRFTSVFWGQEQIKRLINEDVVLRLVYCTRLVNLGKNKQQHLYLRTKNLI